MGSVTKWNYDESVNKIKSIIYSWKSLTEDMMRELKLARKMLNNQGARADLTSDQKIRSWSKYCEDIGSSRGIINRWIKNWDNLNLKNHISNNSEENEWYTPPEIIEKARIVMESIDLDPASSSVANRFIKAKQYFTKDDDGLLKEWHGNIWLNPPYSRKLITEFSNCLLAQKQNFSQAIVLVNNATETNWLQSLINESQCICLLKGRIKYLDESEFQVNAPLQGQTILYFGSNINEFINEFSEIGICLIQKKKEENIIQKIG